MVEDSAYPSGPTRQQIQQVCEFGSVTEGDAIVLLKKSNNDPERAIDAYFSDPVGSLREEPPANEWQDQDNIPYADDTSNRGAPAMSRPPSPADNGRRQIDLSYMHAAATASTTKTLKEQEEMYEMDMKRAMAMSQGQTLPEQEHGVTGAGQQFGPATGSYYNPSDWALAPVTTSREVIEHPVPSRRRRIGDEPVFLRGGSDTGYLASLLTIFHSIPLARHALLFPSMRVSTYGYDPSWWSGSTDENRKSLLMETPDGYSKDRQNFLAEVQCLMAFLDNTQRAYGCVDALADLNLLRSYNAESSLSHFLQAWRDAALQQSPQDQLTQIFTSIAMKTERSMDIAVTQKSLVCLEAPVMRYEGQLLVDLLDHTVWNDTAGNIDDVWIDQTAEVFTMRLFDPLKLKQGLNLTIPAIWYPDRYMEHCKTLTREMRGEIQQIRKNIEHYSAMQRRCQSIADPNRSQLKIRDTLDAASKFSASVLTEKLSVNGAYSDDQDLPPQQITMEHVQRLNTELQTILSKIDQKVNLLEQKKNQLSQEMRRVALQLTQPSEDISQPPYRKYTLQGVSTKPNITYIRQPRKDLIYIDDDSDEDDTQRGDNQIRDWQWWRIWWSIDGAIESPYSRTIGPLTRTEAESKKPPGQRDVAHNHNTANVAEHNKKYSVSKVSEADVIESAKYEHDSVVLVYANENAMKFPVGQLSLSLQHFVEQDNQMFAHNIRNELNEEVGDDSNTEGPFEQIHLGGDSGQNSSGREMTPMSISSPHRDEDGQPSPKRPKSAENQDFSSILDRPPPSYDEIVGNKEMQEKKGNKIGLYAERMLERYGRDVAVEGSYDTDDAMNVQNRDEHR